MAMQLDQLRANLDSPDKARKLLGAWQMRDSERGWHNLTRIADAIGIDAMRQLVHPLGRLLPRCPAPDMALNNLERFLANPRGVQQLPALLEARARSLEPLLQMLSTSQFFSDLLVANPDFLDMLRIPLRGTPSLLEMRDQ